MKTRKYIEVLAAEVIEELKNLNYTYNTICGLRASFNRICSFAQDRGELYFSEKLGRVQCPPLHRQHKHKDSLINLRIPWYFTKMHDGCYNTPPVYDTRLIRAT